MTEPPAVAQRPTPSMRWRYRAIFWISRLLRVEPVLQIDARAGPRGVVTAETSDHAVQVLIDDTPHVVLDRRRAVAMHTWKVRAGRKYVIEILLESSHGTMQLEYDDRALWQRVADVLGPVLIPPRASPEEQR